MSTATADSATDRRDIACVILAGGKGKRMGSEGRHKVCFPVAGVPAIVRGIESYKAAGLRRFVVVVGQMADDVMATVASAHPDVSFAFQSEPRGTGHAAQVGAAALRGQGFEGDVVITMGDKVIATETVSRLLTVFADSASDLVMAALPKEASPTAGRVLTTSDGRVAGVVEVADIRRARGTGHTLTVGSGEMTADDLEQACSWVNASLYMFRFGGLCDALAGLTSDNAQEELYLTDTVATLSTSGKVAVLEIADPTDLMAFNTPAELLTIEEELRRRRGTQVGERPGPVPRSQIRRLSDWCRALDDPGLGLMNHLRGIYGPSDALVAERRSALCRIARRAADTLGGDRRAVLCRAPGRINLMGRHVDHRGGYVNVIAINREIVVAAAPRNDDVVTLTHEREEEFPRREFRIRDLLQDISWGDWLDFIESVTVREVLRTAPGDWSHYARAPILRLQHEFADVKLKGMDCVVGGDIPMGAGLSSSSALVVAIMEATVALNRLEVTPREFVDLCGEGEWFVGSRGGSADHAAIRTGKRGFVSRIGFFPFRLEGGAPLPDDLRVVVANSGRKAVKSAGARDVFNQRVASYQLSEIILRREWPAAHGMEHLRDLVPDRLGVAPADVYRAIKRLPDRPSRRSLADWVSAAELERILASHGNVGSYDLRGVTLFGLAECARSDRFAELLNRGDMAGIGAMMRASHDGDRVWRHDARGREVRIRVSLSDRQLGRLAAAGADLATQTGRYACSTSEIDDLVDIACAVPGVVGAQLAGAGLGGCMMIVARERACEELIGELARRFYAPRDMPCGAEVYQPVAGAGLLSL